VDPTASLIVGLAGGLAGALAGLVPGLHPNTLAAGALALDASRGLPGLATIAFLLAALGAWTFTAAVPLVVLGVPEGEQAPALHPGQRLARAGQAGRALAASAKGSTIGLALGIPGALLLARAFAVPGAEDAIQLATPIVAALATAALVLTDPAGLLPASLIAVLAAALGKIALDVPVSSPLGWPATPLLPLFIGLFGLPALVHAAKSRPDDTEPLPGQRSRAPGPGTKGPVVGSLLGLVSGTFSGFTAGPATAIAARLGRQRATAIMATTSAVNTATACVATGVLHAVQRTRTGVHAARLALAWPLPGWDAVLGDLAATSVGALVGLLGLAAARARADPLAEQVPRLAGWLVPVWLATVAAFTGWAGGLIALAAWASARAAHAAGCRRSLLMACLLGPAILRGIGL
jgi:TctA family transporter